MHIIFSNHLKFKNNQVKNRIIWLIIYLFWAAPLSNAQNNGPGVLKLADNGRTGYIIRLAPGSAVVERFAADELQKYLEKVTGAKMPIDSGQHLPLAPSIFIGKKLALEKGLTTRLDSVEQDGFLIKTVGKDVFLAGNEPRATLYAVYDLLEKTGCRWFAPNFDFYRPFDGEYIPWLPELTLPAYNYIENPSMKIRSKDGGEGISYTSENMIRVFDWMAKQKLNTFCYQIDFMGKGINPWEQFREEVVPEAKKRGIILEIGGHGWNYFLRQDKYFDQHPEWFATINGIPTDKHNYVFNTANPEALEVLTNEIIAYLKNHPEIDIFDCWPPDGTRWSDDPSSMAQGMPPTRLAIVTNYITKRVREALPGKKIEFITYKDFLAPLADVKYEPGLLMEFCPSGRSYKYPIWSPGHEANIKYYGDLREWLKKGAFPGDVSIYTYYRKYVWGSLPIIIPRLMAKEIRFYHNLGVVGIRMFGEPADWFTYELNHYMHAKAVWNVNIPPDAVIQDLCMHRYGDAAEWAQKYFALAEETFPKCLSIPGSDVKSVEEMEGYSVNLKLCQGFLDSASVAAKNNERVAGLIERLSIMQQYASLDYAINLESMKIWKILLWSRLAPTELVKNYNALRALFWETQGKGIILQREGWYPEFKLENSTE